MTPDQSRTALRDVPAGGWPDDATWAVLLAALPVEDRSHLPWADLWRDCGSTGHGDVPWEDCSRALNAIGYDGPISVDRLIRAPEVPAFVRKPALDASAAPCSTPHSRGRTEAGAGPVTQPVAGLRLVGEDSVRPSPFSPAICHHQSQLPAPVREGRTTCPR
jgi:hypothetical protein